MEIIDYQFPVGAVVCEQGDYLFCGEPGGEHKLYRVEDLVLIRKLYRMTGEAEPTYFEAERLVDSAGPHYPDEIHLLLMIVDQPGPLPPPATDEEVLTVTALPIVRAASVMPATRCRNLGKTPEVPSERSTK